MSDEKVSEKLLTLATAQATLEQAKKALKMAQRNARNANQQVVLAAKLLGQAELALGIAESGADRMVEGVECDFSHELANLKPLTEAEQEKQWDDMCRMAPELVGLLEALETNDGAEILERLTEYDATAPQRRAKLYKEVQMAFNWCKYESFRLLVNAIHDGERALAEAARWALSDLVDMTQFKDRADYERVLADMIEVGLEQLRNGRKLKEPPEKFDREE